MMEKHSHCLLNFFLSTLIILSIISVSSAFLSTKSRWIVSPSGDRVKFRCVNWAGHLNIMIPEGLDKQPMKSIAQKVKGMGFNCVRLTWAVHMFTKNKNLTVEQSLNTWKLNDAMARIQKNNPRILKMSLADAQKAVIDELGANKIMVVLDNHVSEPKWCCGNNDGNGFFGDTYFDPKDWLDALGIVANRYKGNPAVVGMSLRNEIRGPHQNVNTWYQYMQQGAEAVHKQSPGFLVIVSGLNYDTQLNFLKRRPFKVSFKNKLVFESHVYAFGNPDEKWNHQTNQFCSTKSKGFFNQSGFLISGPNAYPLFISEFGVNQKVEIERETNYFSCVLAFIAKYDFDWALWTLQGSYMLREGNRHDVEETYGMLSKDWQSVKNPNMLKKLQLIQQTNLASKSPPPLYSKMFHPQTGLCVQANKTNVYATECKTWASWSHKGDGTPIKLSSDGSCLVATGDNKPVSLSKNCSGKGAIWTTISASKLHLASKDTQGNSLCLELDHNNIVTRKCLCVDKNDHDFPYCKFHPTRQWFKLVPFSTQKYNTFGFAEHI